MYGLKPVPFNRSPYPLTEASTLHFAFAKIPNAFALVGYGLKLKGTGFSPYLNTLKNREPYRLLKNSCLAQNLKALLQNI
jgi:hypothetical protein